MKFLKTTFASVALLAFMASAQASPINVGGVVWDPDYVSGTENDFIAENQFTQWYGASAHAAGNVVYTDATAIGTVLSSVTGGSAATGYVLQGSGRLGRINDNAGNIGAGFGGAGSFCPGCEVTIGFGGIGLNKDNTFDVSASWLRLYVDTSTAYVSPPTSQGAVNKALDGNLWLDLKFSNFGFFGGGSVGGGFTSSTLQVIGGLAAANFDPSALSFVSSAFFGSGGALNPAQLYSNGGNGTVLGNTIPEPSSLALIGLGFIGAGLARRKANKA